MNKSKMDGIYEKRTMKLGVCVFVLGFFANSIWANKGNLPFVPDTNALVYVTNGTVVGGSAKEVEFGSNVTIRANPAQSGYTFDRWVSDLPSFYFDDTSPTVTFPMPATAGFFTTVAPALRLTATYKILYCKLTVINGSGGGIRQAGTTMSISARTPELRGDYNGDCFVDGVDILAWQRQNGTSVSPVGSGADGNGDGLVDITDMNVIHANMGETCASKVFDKWVVSGQAELMDMYSPTTTVTLSEDSTLTATFKKASPHKLTVVNGSGSGTFMAGTPIEIAAGTALQGDFNDDCVVDESDIMIFMRQYGQSVLPVGSGADADSNGIVDEEDRAILHRDMKKKCGSFVFDKWVVTGTATLGNPLSPVTTIVLSGDSTVVPTFKDVAAKPKEEPQQADDSFKKFINQTKGPMDIKFTSSASQTAVLIIRTATKEFIRQIVQEAGPGENVIKWDGKDKDHKDVPSDMYVLELKVGNKTSKQTVLVVR